MCRFTLSAVTLEISSSHTVRTTLGTLSYALWRRGVGASMKVNWTYPTLSTYTYSEQAVKKLSLKMKISMYLMYFYLIP